MQFVTLSATGLILGISIFAADLLPEDCEAELSSRRQIAIQPRYAAQGASSITDTHATRPKQSLVEFF